MRARSFTILMLIFALLCPCALRAQVRDSVARTLSRQPKLTGGLSTRYSFITGFAVAVRSVSMGAEFGGKLRVGIGYCWLKLPEYDASKPGGQQPFYRDKYLTDASGASYTVVSRLDLDYFFYYSELIFYHTRRWKFNIPFRVGLGNSKYVYDHAGMKIKDSRHFVFLYEPSVCLEYKLFRFFGLGAEVGYRFMLINNNAIREKFNYPVYNFSFLVYYSEVFKAVFPGSRWSKKL
ncbi:MAG: hypothetical protein AB1458_04340 [Bacteroidota bacterium]